MDRWIDLWDKGGKWRLAAWGARLEKEVRRGRMDGGSEEEVFAWLFEEWLECDGLGWRGLSTGRGKGDD